MQLNNCLFDFVASVVLGQITLLHKKCHFNLQSKEGGWKCAISHFLRLQHGEKFEYMCTSTM